MYWPRLSRARHQACACEPVMQLAEGGMSPKRCKQWGCHREKVPRKKVTPALLYFSMRTRNACPARLSLAGLGPWSHYVAALDGTRFGAKNHTTPVLVVTMDN